MTGLGETGHDPRRQFTQVHLLRCVVFAALRPRQIQQLAQDPPGPQCFVLQCGQRRGAVGRVGLVRRVLRLQGDDRQRRAQLVRHIGGEFAFAADLRLQFVDQSVDGPHHAVEFCEPGRMVQPLAVLQVQACDPGRQRVERLQAALHRPPEQDGDQRQHDQCRAGDRDRHVAADPGPLLQVDHGGGAAGTAGALGCEHAPVAGPFFATGERGESRVAVGLGDRPALVQRTAVGHDQAVVPHDDGHAAGEVEVASQWNEGSKLALDRDLDR